MMKWQHQRQHDVTPCCCGGTCGAAEHTEGTNWKVNSEEGSSMFLRNTDTKYLITPQSRVLEKLTGFQPVKKFPAFYGTRRFITALTSARQLSLS